MTNCQLQILTKWHINFENIKVITIYEVYTSIYSKIYFHAQYDADSASGYRSTCFESFECCQIAVLGYKSNDVIFFKNIW